MVQQVLRPRSRLKALAQALLLFVAGTSCVHRTRSVETRALPASERPVLTEATGTPLRADWQVESGVLLGQLEWADACVLERSQTVVEEETIKKEPATGAGVALLVAGVATAVTGLVLEASAEEETRCSSPPAMQGYIPAIECDTERNPPRALTLSLTLGGVLLGSLGVATLRGKPSSSVHERSRREESVRGTQAVACGTPENTAGLVFVAILPDGRRLQTRANAHGQVKFTLPPDMASAGASPGPGQIVVAVAEVQPELAHFVKRGLVLGRVDLPGTEAAPTPAGR